MTSPLETRLLECATNDVARARLRDHGALLFEQRGHDAVAGQLDDGHARGLGLGLACQRETGFFLAHRPALLERVANASADDLAGAPDELAARAAEMPLDDLEACLDGVRLLRREETCIASAIDLGGIAPFEAVSLHLSYLAEAITGRCLELARHQVAPEETFAVLGMGKIAGREFTYHSDLDLIFLYDGGVDRIEVASRIGQRLVSYLTTLTGAGIAYPVDTRLRPSGQQGMLVTSLGRFEEYQRASAQTWEHVALLRARPVAGAIRPTGDMLSRLRGELHAGDVPWRDLRGMRERVEEERGADSDGEISFKTGPGGLMDVDFLAGGALLERGGREDIDLPSVPAMLRGAVAGPRVDALLADYAELRRVEARARLLRGRAVESAPSTGDEASLMAELLGVADSGMSWIDDVHATRRRVREAFTRVLEADSIAALEAPPNGDA